MPYKETKKLAFEPVSTRIEICHILYLVNAVEENTHKPGFGMSATNVVIGSALLVLAVTMGNIVLEALNAVNAHLEF